MLVGNKSYSLLPHTEGWLARRLKKEDYRSNDQHDFREYYSKVITYFGVSVTAYTGHEKDGKRQIIND